MSEPVAPSLTQEAVCRGVDSWLTQEIAPATWRRSPAPEPKRRRENKEAW